jgi:hypothetical protein
MNDELSTEVRARADGRPTTADTQSSAEDHEVRFATGLAIAAAAISLTGFVSLFRLRVRWDQSRARAFRRFIGVQATSLTGIALGYRSLIQLLQRSSDKRGVPFAAMGIVLGASNVVRAVSWLWQDRSEI